MKDRTLTEKEDREDKKVRQFILFCRTVLKKEKLNYYKMPKALAGFPVAMVTASFICMAFMVFSFI